MDDQERHRHDGTELVHVTDEDEEDGDDGDDERCHDRLFVWPVLLLGEKDVNKCEVDRAAMMWKDRNVIFDDSQDHQSIEEFGTPLRKQSMYLPCDPKQYNT